MRKRTTMGGAVMGTFEKPKPKPADRVPFDLLPVVYESGVLTERQFADVRGKVQKKEYPSDPTLLAERLIEDGVLTEYQARRFLNNKSHGLAVGRYIILD